MGAKWCQQVPPAGVIAPEEPTNTAAAEGGLGGAIVRCPQCKAVIGVPSGVQIGGVFKCTCGEHLCLQPA